MATLRIPTPANKSRSSVAISAFSGVLLFASLFGWAFQWWNDRQALKESLSRIRASITELDLHLQVQTLDRNSGAHLLSDARDLLRRLEEGFLQLSRDRACEVAKTDPENTEEALDSSLSTAPLDDLPLLPEGVNARLTFRREVDIADILKDEAWNPKGKELDELTLAELRVDFARARGRVDALEAQMYYELAKARGALRERGEFIEYAPGQEYATIPGVLTAAEQLADGGVRMYYLTEGEFPDLYANRKQRDEQAERALRQVRKRLDDL